MSKLRCFAFVLAVICLPIIMLSLEADAQPTVDETTTCSASTLEEIAMDIKKDFKDEIKGVKQLIVSGKEDACQPKNETSLVEVANDIKDHVDLVLYLLNDEIADVKKLLASGSKENNESRLEDVVKEMRDEIKDLKKMLTSGSGGTKNETTLEEVAKEIKDEIKDLKKMLTSESGGSRNETTLEDAVREIKDEIADVKRLFVSESKESNESRLENAMKEIKDEIKDVKRLLLAVSNCSSLLIQQHFNGSSFFNRSWAEYKVGFGDPSGDYWIGNDRLSQLTMTGRYKLKFDLQSRSNTSNWYWAEYSTFTVQSEADNYRLNVAGYSGNAGYDALDYSNGRMFTTYDRDNDVRPSENCAVLSGGGFWYRSCALCGVNNARGSFDGFEWRRLPGGRLLQSSRMWLQCK